MSISFIQIRNTFRYTYIYPMCIHIHIHIYIYIYIYISRKKNSGGKVAQPKRPQLKHFVPGHHCPCSGYRIAY